MKILITGAAGFIGSHLSQKLTEKGHEVIAIDNFFHPSKNPNKVIQRDIRQPIDDLVSVVDIVFHLAAQIHVDYSIVYPKETVDININGLLNILEACRKYNKKLVFASSSEIYGSFEGVINEFNDTRPQSTYAVTKLTGDKLCSVYRDVYGMKINIIRNFNTFGEWQNDDSYGGVIAIFTRCALKGEPLRIYGDGNQERDYMYIDDALQGYLLSLDHDFKWPLNFGSGKSISINELAKMIKEITGSNSEIVHVDPRPNEVQKLLCDSALASEYGFVSNTDFKRDLTKYIKWYQQFQLQP